MCVWSHSSYGMTRETIDLPTNHQLQVQVVEINKLTELLSLHRTIDLSPIYLYLNLKTHKAQQRRMKTYSQGTCSDKTCKKAWCTFFLKRKTRAEAEQDYKSHKRTHLQYRTNGGSSFLIHDRVRTWGLNRMTQEDDGI